MELPRSAVFNGGQFSRRKVQRRSQAARQFLRRGWSHRKARVAYRRSIGWRRAVAGFLRRCRGTAANDSATARGNGKTGKARADVWWLSSGPAVPQGNEDKTRRLGTRARRATSFRKHETTI